MKIIYNIGLLVGIQPEGVLRVEGEAQGQTGVLRNAWLSIVDGRIADYGPMSQFCHSERSEESLDAHGGMVMPGFATVIPMWYMPAAGMESFWTRSMALAMRKSQPGAAAS